MSEEEETTYEMNEEEKRLKAKEPEEDAELARVKGEVIGTNRKIDDDYDDKMKKLDEKRKARPDTAEDIKNTLLSLKERVVELKNAMSEARKQGKDVFIAELKLRNINPKMKMAEISGEMDDIAKIEVMLNDVEYELEAALESEEVNVKKEIEERLKAELARAKERRDADRSEA